MRRASFGLWSSLLALFWLSGRAVASGFELALLHDLGDGLEPAGRVVPDVSPGGEVRTLTSV